MGVFDDYYEKIEAEGEFPCDPLDPYEDLRGFGKAPYHRPALDKVSGASKRRCDQMDWFTQSGWDILMTSKG